MVVANIAHGRRSAGTRSPGRIPRIARAVGKAITTGLLILVCGLLVMTVGVPIATGADTYTVLTRSMEPGLPAQDSLHVGDVVTYQLHPGKPDVVTHRIVRVEASSDGTKRYITRGDANAVADASPVRAEQVRGRVWYAIPAVGWLAVVKNGTSLQPWLIGVGALLVLYSLVSIARWLRSRRRRDAAPVVHRETYIPL